MGVNFVNIPQELKQNASFCVWKKELRQGKMAKVPYNPVTGEKAQTNNPSTFSNFATAMKAYALGGTEGHPDWDGIGFRVSEGIGAIDIDHCIREDGTLNDVAASVLGFFKDAYFERSPSGSGLRGFFMLSPDFAYDRTAYYINNRRLGMEVYLPGTTNRFVTVTGNVYRAGSVPLDMEALRSVLDTFMKRKSRAANTVVEPCSYLNDEQVIEHASRSASGDKFRALYGGKWEGFYGSQSDADMAFVSMLAFWCGNMEDQIDRIFRSSGLMRDKWDRVTGDSTYGQITIRNAVATNGSIYLPIRDTDSAVDDFEELDEGSQEERDRREREGYDFEPAYGVLTTSIPAMKPESNPRYQRDEIGIGYLFADYYREIARYSPERKKWFVYDGSVWRPDVGGLKVSEMAKRLADETYMHALSIQEEDTRKRYIGRVMKLQLRRNRETMLKDAMSVYPITVAAFDRDPYLFNCKNGTLDLSSGSFRGHDPLDFHTKISNAVYDPEASCPRWVQFIDEVTKGDREEGRYIQKALGYSLSGDTRLECFFILYGATSRNGKGTTMDTFLRLIGEYGRNANPDMLGTKYNAGGSSGGPSEEVARLNGARFVNISEPDKKLTINASLVKQLTGNDKITARFLHENSIEFYPQFKIFINTNHRPTITDLTLFRSGRVNLIPFERHFEEDEQDKDLKKFFAEEHNMSGILNWCLEGYRLYLEEGMRMPESVQKATRDYEYDSDKLGQFIDECIVEKPGEEIPQKEFYDAYVNWCTDNSCYPEKKTNVLQAVKTMYRVDKHRPKNDKSRGATDMIEGITWNDDALILVR